MERRDQEGRRAVRQARRLAPGAAMLRGTSCDVCPSRFPSARRWPRCQRKPVGGIFHPENGPAAPRVRLRAHLRPANPRLVEAQRAAESGATCAQAALSPELFEAGRGSGVANSQPAKSCADDDHDLLTCASMRPSKGLVTLPPTPPPSACTPTARPSTPAARTPAPPLRPLRTGGMGTSLRSTRSRSSPAKNGWALNSEVRAAPGRRAGSRCISAQINCAALGEALGGA